VIGLELNGHDVSVGLEDRRCDRLIAAITSQFIRPVQGLTLKCGNVVVVAPGVDLQLQEVESGKNDVYFFICNVYVRERVCVCIVFATISHLL